jgi:MoaA/NifB/PqqE/SkfB family radical SAM enzyme
MKPFATGSLRPNRRNRYRAQWEFARGTAKASATPTSLQLARSNLCNFKCVYCGDHRVGNQVPRTKLEGKVWDDLATLIPATEDLGFHGISEFFMDPDFFEILDECARAGSALSLNTNGSVCTPRHLAALQSYPGDIWITFSLDAATPETFLKIRGQEFWRIVKNIQAYIEAFQSRKARTGVWLSFVVNGTSYREMLPFLYLARALKADGVTYFRLHEYEGLDWQVEMKGGGLFDYKKQYVRTFAAEYNRELERVRKAAELFPMHIDLPAPEPEPSTAETL